MEKITYTARADGGYNASTSKGTITVKKFYLPAGTPVWIATCKGITAGGGTRREAVASVYNKLK